MPSEQQKIKLSLDNAVNFYDFFEGVETVLVVSNPKKVVLTVENEGEEPSSVNLRDNNVVILCMSGEITPEKGVFAVISDLPTTQLDVENGRTTPEIANSGS